MAHGHHWYVVKEERAREFEGRGFPIKQKHNGKWLVLCHPSQLWPSELDRKGIVAVNLEEPAELHRAIADAVGEDLDIRNQPWNRS